jgi:serine protease Do
MTLRVALLLAALALPSVADPAGYIDDDHIATTLRTKILNLADDGKATRGKELLKQMDRKSCDTAPAAPGALVLSPEEIYSGCAGGVVAITSAWKSGDGEHWEAGDPATAWVLTPDGVMVTNYHVFEGAKKEEVFGILTRTGAFHPVKEILAADPLNDVAVFRVSGAKGLQPMSLGADEPVGKKVCVISHPDNQFYSFTQGEISRYTLQRDAPGQPPVKYMSITADYARGSSGGPVLNDRGAVIGMVCSTRTTYYGEKGKDPDDDVQMVAKFCIPAASIRALLKSTPALPPAPGPGAAEKPAPSPAPPTAESGTPALPAPKAEPVPE